MNLYQNKAAAVSFLFVFLLSASLYSLDFTYIPDGYKADSINIGDMPSGAFAADPNNPAIIYAGAGSWMNNYIIKVNLSTKTYVNVCSGYSGSPFGNAAGLALLPSGELIIVDNANANTIFIARDNDSDGDFNDSGEVSELIAPILADNGDFTGSKTRVVSAAGASSIPGGSIVIQTADGGTLSDLLVITNPAASPAFRPTGGRYFGGFTYDGGFDFDKNGNIIMGTTTSNFLSEIWGLVNLNSDEDIDFGESNIILGESRFSSGISDLIIDGNNNGYCSNGFAISKFSIPTNPLTDSSTLQPYAGVNGWIVGLILNSKTLSFAPNSGRGAKMVIGAYGENNLLILTPSGTDPFPDAVTSITYGTGSGFGEDYFPDNVLGAPYGGPDAAHPQDAQSQLLSLGDGGEIILEFDNNVVVDRDGVDLAIFENPVVQEGFSNQSFVEAAIVSVSQDGVNYYTFPYDFIPPEQGESLGDWSNYVGLAGVHPVYSNPTNGISSINPTVSGGDFFDLADVGLNWAKYVKIKDTGTPGTATEMRDSDGDSIDDPGNSFNFPSSKTVGFDLDAIAAIHSAAEPPTAADSWEMYQ